LSLALCWLLIDRPLSCGGTAATRYAELADLDATEAEVARRIAGCGLGLYRVTDARAGEWIDLTDVLGGGGVRVSGPLVSGEAVRWHVLLCRVMDGAARSLWGAAGFYEPAEEVELVDELRRIAREHGLVDDEQGLRAALRLGAAELVCFEPPS